MGTSNPQVSVIVPVYNCERFLDDCITSLQEQTMKEWEAIFVNDGSVDRSAEIIASYAAKDARIRIINKVNGGAASARNCGLDVVRTKYVTMVDADDVIHIDAIKKMYDAAVSTECDMVLVSQTLHDEHGNKKEHQFVRHGLQNADPHFLFSNVYRGPMAKLYRMDIINRYNLRMPEDMEIAEDYVFVTSYWTRVKTLYVIPDSLYDYQYQNNPNSLIHRFCNRKMPFDVYRRNAEAAWYTFKFLVSEEKDKEKISFWTYDLYRDLWRMTNNSCRYLPKQDRKKLRRIIAQRERDMAKYISFYNRIRMPHRYPCIVNILLKLRGMWRGFKKGLS